MARPTNSHLYQPLARNQPPASETEKAVNNNLSPAAGGGAFNTTSAASNDPKFAALASPGLSGLPSSTSTAATPSTSNFTGHVVVEESLHNGHNGEFGTFDNGDTPLSPSSMSNHPPPHGPPRQSLSYPSPTTYSPQGLPPGPYAGYPGPTGQDADAYRTNATGGVTVVNSAMALPSMRTVDTMQHSQQAAQAMQMGAQQMGVQQMGTQMATPLPHGAAPVVYYNPHYAMHHDPNAIRYALPPTMTTDPRMAMGVGRHKKEIKRRTKTGCLTCRRRRIKCDETHPTCNNCKKSKRECLGYDPIFKAAQAHAQNAANAQAAAMTSQSTAPAITPTTTLASDTRNSSPKFDNLDIVWESDGTAVPPHLRDPALVGAIDPALQAVTSPTGSDPQLQYQADRSADGTVVSTSGSSTRAKMKVDDLVKLGMAQQPPAQYSGNTDFEEITKIYYEIYGPGLTAFFETQWYNFKEQPDAKNSILILRKHQPTLDTFAYFLETIGSVTTTDPPDMDFAGQLETNLVWSLACLVMRAVPANSGKRATGQFLPALPDDDPCEARNRLRVFEALLSGKTLSPNPLNRPPPDNIGDSVRAKEFAFWYFLGEYIRLPEPEARLASLSHMRIMLDGRENRDLLYSLAVLRELSPHYPAGCENDAPRHLDEADPRNKLIVATRFVRQEAESTGGTTNVVRRFSQLALKSFIDPGVNVARAD